MAVAVTACELRLRGGARLALGSSLGLAGDWSGLCARDRSLQGQDSCRLRETPKIKEKQEKKTNKPSAFGGRGFSGTSQESRLRNTVETVTNILGLVFGERRKSTNKNKKKIFI